MNKSNQKRQTKPWSVWGVCQTCKQKYVRCDEGQPVCSTCGKNRGASDHTLPPDKRPLSPPQDTQSRLANRGLPDSRLFSASQGHTLPLLKYDFTGDTILTDASIPASLDPYPQSLLPLNPARRALLAFCKRYIIPFLIHPGPIGSLQAN